MIEQVDDKLSADKYLLDVYHKREISAITHKPVKNNQPELNEAWSVFGPILCTYRARSCHLSEITASGNSKRMFTCGTLQIIQLMVL
jgi:hypothetical protein